MGIPKKYRLLAIVHLCFLASCASYISLQYEGSFFICSFLFFTSLCIEAMPQTWRQRGMGEIGVLVSALLAYVLSWSMSSHQEESLQGLARMILVTWILIPSRPGLLRPLILLIAMELLLLSSRDHNAIFSALVLSSLALHALFFDTWLRMSFSPNSGTRIRKRYVASPWRHLFMLIPITCIIAYSCAWYVLALGKEHHFNINRGPTIGSHILGKGTGSIDLDNKLHIGSNQWINQSSDVIAKYIPDNQDQLQQRHYLRGLAVPVFTLESKGHISWNTPKSARHFTGEKFAIPEGEGSHVIRFPAGDKILLRPDGSGIPPLKQFFLDSEGNLYLPQANSTAISYRCDSSSDHYIKTARNTQSDIRNYLRVPDVALDMFRNSLPQLEQWRVLNRADTAHAITAYLHQRCRYQINDLPTPKDQPLSSIHIFLFGSQQERIGHCQYFATAATLLLRSCKIPARPVFGFASSELSSDKDMTIFRAWHAHAWVEYLDQTGSWHRLETTPAGYLQQRIAGSESTESHDDPNKNIVDVNDTFNAGQVPWYILIALTGIAGIAILLITIRRARNPQLHLSARARQLCQQQQALITCAQQMGIRVRPCDTLSSIVHAVELHCDMDLRQQLNQHLTALYYDNDADNDADNDHQLLPPPWPIKEIRRSADLKKSSAHIPASEI